MDGKSIARLGARSRRKDLPGIQARGAREGRRSSIPCSHSPSTISCPDSAVYRRAVASLVGNRQASELLRSVAKSSWRELVFVSGTLPARGTCDWLPKIRPRYAWSGYTSGFRRLKRSIAARM
jgi:hypothetical protein